MTPSTTAAIYSSTYSSPTTHSSRNQEPENSGSGRKRSNHSRTMNNNDCPSAPSPGLVLFNTEDQSDISFIVGTSDTDTWRFPAHSFVLSDSSPVFANIISTLNNHRSVNDQDLDGLNKSCGKDGKESNTSREIMIHCHPEIFCIMLRYIYKNEIKLNSVSNSLNLISVANQFELYELSQLCFEWLLFNVTAQNVLDILAFLRKPLPSAMYGFLIQDGGGDQEMNILNELVVKCCSILDSNCEEILKSDSIYQLDQELLMEILTRDSLVVSTELIIFEALTNYANHQCLKQRKPLTPESKREVLGKSLYSARFLVMSMDDYMRGPYSSDILTDEEKDVLLSKLKCQGKQIGFDCITLPMHMLGLKLDLPRTGLTGKDGSRTKTMIVGTKNVLKRENVEVQSNEEVINKKKSLKKRCSNGLSKLAIVLIQIID